MLPAGRDDEVGGQGRGRQGRGPGVLRHDDGAHEEAPRRQEQRSQVKQDGGKTDITYSENLLFTFCTFISQNFTFSTFGRK